MEIKLKKESDYSALYSAIEKQDLIDKNIILDLSNHDFFEPHLILMLVMFIILNIKRGKHISIVLPLNKSAHEYLENISLIDFCKTNYEQPISLNAITSLTAMPIRRITTETMNEYISGAVAYFQTMCDGKDLTMLNISISELINNVYDHAESPIDAYVFCQYFPSSKEIKIAVADLGIGIPKSVNRHLDEEGLEELPPIDTIEWALKENTSTKSKPHNKGKGLANLVSFIDSDKSTFSVYSNEFIFVRKPDFGRTIENPINFFKGTIVNVTIKVSNLLEQHLDEFVEDIW